MAAAEDRDPAAPDVSFAVVRHGFDRTAVRRHLDELTARLERAEADRHEARDQAAEYQGELEIARREIAALTERLDSFGAPEGADGGRMLEIARSQAAEITARAKAAADGTWSAAEEASAQLRERYRTLLGELDAQQEELRASHQEIMRTAQAQAEEMTTAAERRRREIDAAAERDRVRIDREFSESMAARREALDQELAERRAAAEREIAEQLRVADEEAKRRLDTVNAQVERLSAVRSQLSERLRETQELLERGAGLLEPTDLEREVDPDQRPPTADGAAADAPTKRAVPPQRQPAKR